MRYLLDTHALIWWWDKTRRLPDIVIGELENRRNFVGVSSVSGWEIATKVRAGRLPTMAERVRHYVENVTEDGFEHLVVRPEHGVAAGLLEGAHKDPFDRLIAAHALLDGLTVITCDPGIAAFGCEVLW